MDLLNLRYKPQEDERTNYGTNQRTDEAVGLNAEQGKEPAANDATDDTQEEVDEQSLAGAALQFACYEAGQCTDDEANECRYHFNSLTF